MLILLKDDFGFGKRLRAGDAGTQPADSFVIHAAEIDAGGRGQAEFDDPGHPDFGLAAEQLHAELRRNNTDDCVVPGIEREVLADGGLRSAKEAGGQFISDHYYLIAA